MHFATTAALLALSTAAQAHMVMNKPQAFHSQAYPNGEQFDNGPLSNAQEGGQPNYPCKYAPSTMSAADVYAFTFPRTEMALGSNQTLQFMGSAVHGGGSCQVSLTKDLEPTADSVFKVIHTIHGGCPARNTAGNLDGSATLVDPNEYDFTVHPELQTGNYTLAWTWLNKVGNREFYMQCAPITITQGSSSKRDLEERDSYFDSLPDIFLANLSEDPINGNCGTTSDTDVTFPNPGKYIETNAEGSDFAPPIMKAGVNCHAPLNMKSLSASSSTSSSSSDSDSSDSSSMSSSSAATYSTTSVSVPMSSSTTVSDGSSSSSMSYDAPETSSTSSASSSSGPCPNDTVSCSNPGSMICVSATQFGICNTNNCAVPQDVAAGTQCQNGQIMKRSSIPPLGRSHGLWSLRMPF